MAKVEEMVGKEVGKEEGAKEEVAKELVASLHLHLPSKQKQPRPPNAGIIRAPRFDTHRILLLSSACTLQGPVETGT
jgi:hypothetical protein